MIFEKLFNLFGIGAPVFCSPGASGPGTYWIDPMPDVMSDCKQVRGERGGFG
jgi:hypothetical protein